MSSGMGSAKEVVQMEHSTMVACARNAAKIARDVRRIRNAVNVSLVPTFLGGIVMPNVHMARL